jgi:hypothetical protein
MVVPDGENYILYVEPKFEIYANDINMEVFVLDEEEREKFEYMQ